MPRVAVACLDHETPPQKQAPVPVACPRAGPSLKLPRDRPKRGRQIDTEHPERGIEGALRRGSRRCDRASAAKHPNLSGYIAILRYRIIT